jgi:signal transduction histidine kinase
MKEPLTGLDVPSKLTLNVVDAPFTENFHHLHGYYMACCVASISSMLNEAKLKIKLAKIKENVSEKTHTIRGELSKIVLVKSLLEEMLLARHTPSTQSLPLVRSIDLLGRVLEGVNESLPKGSDFVLTPEQKVRKLALKNVNLVTFVNETFEACCLAQGRVSSKSVPIIKFTLKSKLPVTWSGWVHLNRSYVEDVLYNLISNAVKYAKTAIFVSLETQSLNQELKVLVRDDGIGIRDEKLKDVFKGGAMQLASKQVSGAHVGLSHCKRSADKLGDTLLVRNQGVSGAEFEFVTRCSPSIRLKKRVSAKPVVLLEKKCILVEDNAINMAVLLRMVKLHVSSAYIRTFRSATLALSHILQHPDVSFIISDQELGDELKGSAFIKMLRVFYESNPKWSLPKCAIATGYTELGQGEDVHLISKPVTKNKISTFFRSERPGIVQVEQRVPVTASSPGV